MNRPATSFVFAAALFAACSAGLSAPAFAQERPMLRISSGAADNATLDPHRATSTAQISREVLKGQ